MLLGTLQFCLEHASDGGGGLHCPDCVQPLGLGLCLVLHQVLRSILCYYVLFDIYYSHLTRWQKISRLETCNDYRPEPELLPTAVTPEAGQAEAAERLTEAGDKFDK